MFVDSVKGRSRSNSSSGSGGSTCSQLLSTSGSASASASASASTSVSVEVSVTLTHVTPASEGVSASLLLLSLASPVLASSPTVPEEASAATGAAFSSLTGSTTESSALVFSFSASDSAALLSSSSFSFSYTYNNQHLIPLYEFTQTHLFFLFALFRFPFFLELFAQLSLGYHPSRRTFSCRFWS